MMPSKKFRFLASLKNETDPEFQIAPMIDMLLVLLIFFMSITATNVMMKDTAIILPEASHANTPDKNQSLGQCIINIRWNSSQKINQISLDEMSMNNINRLIIELNQKKIAFKKVKPEMNYRVMIRADQKVPYRLIKKIMKACQQSDIHRVTFSVMQGGLES